MKANILEWISTQVCPPVFIQSPCRCKKMENNLIKLVSKSTLIAKDHQVGGGNDHRPLKSRPFSGSFLHPNSNRSLSTRMASQPLWMCRNLKLRRTICACFPIPSLPMRFRTWTVQMCYRDMESKWESSV